MNVQCHSAEQFEETTFLLGPATDFITPGVKATLSVPASATQRHIWIACGAHYQYAKADHWILQGRLKFYNQTTEVGFLEFSDASSELTAAERLLAPRTVTRISASGDGSTQPVLRYQRDDGAADTWSLTPDGGGGYDAARDPGPPHRDNLDMPCLSIRVECDRIVYVLEKSYCATNAAFVLGLRCVSHP